MADSGLNAQCLRSERFLKVSKRRIEGIWTDFSCILDCVLLSSRYQKTVFRLWSMVIAAPLIKFWGLEKDLVIRDSEICVFDMFGVFAIQSRWHRHSCD